MKEILPKIIVFGLSLLMFGIAILHIFLGYIAIGKTGHQKRIYMADEPAKFWTIVAIPLIIGAIAFIWGLLLMFRQGEKR